MAKTAKKKETKAVVSILERCDPLRGEMLQVIDYEGRVVTDSEFPDIKPDLIVDAYKLMVLSRVADAKARSWQRH